MPRLFVVDLDDTLLTKGSLPASVIPVWRKIIECGALVTIATARGLRGATAPLGDAVPRLPLIVSNGAVIVGANREYAKIQEIPTEVVDSVCQISNLVEGVPCFLLTDGWNDSILVSDRTNEFTEWTLNGAGYFRAHTILRGSRPPVDESTKLVRIVFCIALNGAQQLKRDIDHRFPELGTLIIPSRDRPDWAWLEVGAANATKSYGIKHVASLLKIPLSNVVYYGDAVSDLDPMAIVGEAVAVANAQDDVLAAADRVIGTAESGAVAHDLLLQVNSGRNVLPTQSPDNGAIPAKPFQSEGE